MSAPTADVHDAVCCEFVDLGLQTSPFDNKEKQEGMLVFQVAERDELDAGTSCPRQARIYFNLTLGTEKYPSKIRKRRDR